MSKKFEVGYVSFNLNHVHRTPAGEEITEGEMAKIALALLRDRSRQERLNPHKVREVISESGKLGLDGKRVALGYEILIREAVEDMFSKKEPQQ